MVVYPVLYPVRLMPGNHATDGRIREATQIRDHLENGDVLRADGARQPVYLRKNEAGYIEMDHSHRKWRRIRLVLEGTAHESLMLDDGKYEYVVVDADEYPASSLEGEEATIALREGDDA